VNYFERSILESSVRILLESSRYPNREEKKHADSVSHSASEKHCSRVFKSVSSGRVHKVDGIAVRVEIFV